MSVVTDYGTDIWSQTLVGLASVPVTFYIALLAQPAGPGIDGTVLAAIEPPTGVGYARHSYASGSSFWDSTGDGVSTSVDITFAMPTGDWGTLTDFALCTAASAGQVFGSGPLSTPAFVSAGWQLVIPAGALSLTVTALDPSVALT